MVNKNVYTELERLRFLPGVFREQLGSSCGMH